MSKPTGYLSSLGPLKILGLLAGLSLVMRFFSFFPSVLDHDESTYIVIADALRQGQVYLRDVVDTKPIGIFTLFALFQTVFGKSILAIRLITAAWVALTGWMLYLVHRQLIKDTSPGEYNTAPVASGIIYVLAISIFTPYGVSPNTEHFFALFTITALFILLRFQGLRWIGFSGMLLGIGYMIKYVVLFDALALGLMYLSLQVTAGRKWTYWFSRCILMMVGFIIPFTIVFFYYRQMGLQETFLYYSFKVSGHYFIQPPWYKYPTYVLEGLLRFLPVTFWFLFCSWHWRTTGLKLPAFAWLWGGLVMLIILLPGKLFPHYFIQLLLPLSLLAGSFFDLRRSPVSTMAWIRKPLIGYTILVLTLMINVVVQKKGYYDRKDYPKAVAEYLNGVLHPGDIIYTANAYQILYHLTGTRSPTPYIHPSLIWTAENNQALGINQVEEWNKIVEQNPRFIIIKKVLPEGHPMLEALATSYHLVKTFDDLVKVYEKI